MNERRTTILRASRPHRYAGRQAANATDPDHAGRATFGTYVSSSAAGNFTTCPISAER